MRHAARAFSGLPPSAAWEHRDSRRGFEVAFLDAAQGLRVEGQTAAVAGDEPWAVRYVIGLDARWATRTVRVSARSRRGQHEVVLEADGGGSWGVDGQPAAHLDGCLDVDLESSCVTNALPVHRLALEVGHAADVPAAYVRAPDLRVERLEQRYTRLEDAAGGRRYRYEAPAFDFVSDVVYDEAGLVLAYPGIGRRAA